MGRKIDKSQTHLVRTVDDGDWELWSFPETKRAQFVRRLSHPGDAPCETTVALPASRTISFPAWVATNDQAVLPEMLKLRLEQNGLLSKNNNPIDVRIVEKRENQTLALATVLQPEFPKELTFEKAIRFEPSAFTFALPQDRLIVWREQGHLAVTATRGRNPVTFQVLSDNELSESAALELRCMAYQLETQNLCDRLLGVTLWGDFSRDEIERVEKHLDLKVTHDTVPPPVLPPDRSKLLPQEVALLHAKKRRRYRIRNAILLLLGLYVFVVLALLASIAWQTMVADNLRRQIASQAPTVKAIQGTADRWTQVQWAVDPKLYAVELLNQVSGLLPADGLRLTAFESSNGKIVIKGEASNPPAAFKFSEDIKAKPDLQMFNWEMPNPSLRADGRADFTIEGVPKVAKIEQK